ncbi:group II PLP decarboxylase, putative [Ixodes scapularis]|uniref:Group II PLP decarboxylase, putative n=1 Tax=Ixodes scapularis TaxID=6945 RepID=B7QNX0_IXOSC|nr:group II PLP decarboxylase, putative [Ixodes scapularis]|eukprot:XP_002416625.1 group II PLP decarboxylase, putative [Ixodes scapularis]
MDREGSVGAGPPRKTADLYPFSDDGPATRAFLSRVFEILWQYVDQQQDRSSKILDFHMPDKLMQMLDLDLPEDPLDLGQLFKDCSDALKFQVRTDLYPFSDDGPATRAFLSRVFEILWQYVDQQQDRSSKILDFHMPDKLMQMLDLDLPEDPLDLGQLFKDCSDALKFQVRTDPRNNVFEHQHSFQRSMSTPLAFLG